MSIPLYKNHYLQARVISSATDQRLILRARVKLVDGQIVPVERDLGINVPYAPIIFFIPLAIGELLSVVVSHRMGAAYRGQTFVHVTLNDGSGDNGPYEQVLISDYITTIAYLTWPGGLIRQPDEGPGWRHVISPADPLAGANLVYTVGAERKQRFLTVGIRLVTSAALPARLVRLVAIQGGVIVMNRGAQAVQAGGLTVFYRYYFGGSFRQVSAETEEQAAPDIILYATEVINIVVDNMDIADQLSLCVLDVEEWINR